MTAPSPAIRARSAFEIIDASIQVFRRHYATFVMLAAVAMVPLWALLLGTGMVGMLSMLQPGMRASSIPSLGTIGPTLALFPLVYLWSYIVNNAMLVAASDAYVHGSVRAAAALRTALGRSLSLIAAAVMFFLLLMLGALLLLVGRINALLFIPAFLCLIFFEFYVMARYFAILPAIVLEDKGPIACFHRARDLSEGYRWRIFGTMALAWLMCVVVAYTFQILATLLPISFAAKLLLNGVVAILVTPLVWIVLIVLYYDQRIRKDAFDLELMAQQLPAAQMPATS